MPQTMLPIFPDGVVDLTPDLAVQKEAGQIVYFNGMMPVFMHDEDEYFRRITRPQTVRSWGSGNADRKAAPRHTTLDKQHTS